MVILGASGDLTHRKLVPALYEMNRRGARRGLASLCVGVGQGLAVAFDRQ